MRIYSEKTVWLLSFYFSVQNIQKTHAYHRLQDDVPAEVKQRRLQELIAVFREEAARVNGSLVGSTQLVLVEGVSTAPSALHLVRVTHMSLLPLTGLGLSLSDKQNKPGVQLELYSN